MIPVLFNYFGGKGRLSALYPPPKYDIIVESHAGGAGYARRHYERNVLLVDSDPRVIRVWNYLIRSTKDEILALPLMTPGQSIDELDVGEEARLYLSCCVNQTAFRRTLTSWKDGQNRGLWGEDLRRRVADSVHLIKHWQAICADCQTLGNADATWFVDPPYQGMGEHYKNGTVDYPSLAKWCRARQGQVIVCEKRGADWLPFEFLKDARAMSRTGDGNRRSAEAYWTNG